MVYIFTVLIIVYVIVILVTEPERRRQRISKEKEGVETLEYALNKHGIYNSLMHIQPDNNMYIIDKENKELTHLNHNNYFPTYYRLKDIIEVSLVIDGETITSTTRGSQFGGALVGGLLAGGTGAVIGGLSGKTSSKEAVSKISLNVLMSNSKNSITTITFLDEKQPVLKTSETFKKAFNISTEWEGQLKVIIHETKNLNLDSVKDKNKVTDNQNNSSVADEIKKLHTLVEDGILTNEEFALQKEKILSK